jgi:hypothetical protein
MQIRFRQSVATERGAFSRGRVVRVKTLPKGWDAWLRDGVIELVAEDAMPEVAVAPLAPETAVRPRGRRRAPSRTSLAE